MYEPQLSNDLATPLAAAFLEPELGAFALLILLQPSGQSAVVEEWPGVLQLKQHLTECTDLEEVP